MSRDMNPEPVFATDDMHTVVVPDHQVRSVRAAIVHNGGFVVSSCMVSNGYSITWKVDPR